MNEEQLLYKQQMELWLKEQQRIDEQLERAVEHHLELSELNKRQLELHRIRIDHSKKEYETWLSSLEGKEGDDN